MKNFLAWSLSLILYLTAYTIMNMSLWEEIAVGLLFWAGTNVHNSGKQIEQHKQYIRHID